MQGSSAAIVIFYSKLDPAGVNIARALRENHGFSEPAPAEKNGRNFNVRSCGQAAGAVKLVELACPLLEASFLDGFFEASLFLFASKHRSASAKPCLTVHAPGNWGANDFGGNPRELSVTSARALVFFHSKIRGKTLPAFREVTHHGPSSLKTPSVFVELGSSESEWSVPEYGNEVARAIAEGCVGYGNAPGVKAALGFGGTHYCAGFESLPGGFSISHAASKHVLDSVDGQMVRQAMEKTVEPVEKAFIDWKGCSPEQRARLTAILDVVGLPWERA